MKTLTTLIAVVATSFALNANAEFIDTTALGVGEVFPIQSTIVQDNSVAGNTDGLVYDIDSETLVYLNASEKQSVASALRELENNPPAAGKSDNNSSFPSYFWNENLQN
ncbi:MAG: hypothetical protein KZQ83_12475 [gamma proteobacterium symbiont of Taylorina sp.]|nr:hypothetical protein [gamma proteobacterium symbiont of Taylorina sp.]